VKLIARTWRILTWKHWAWATAIPVVVSVLLPLQDFDTNLYWAPWRVLFHTPWFLFISYAFLVAIALAEASVHGDRVPSASRYVVALVAASVVCMASLAAFPHLVRDAPRLVVAGQLIPDKKNRTPETRAEAHRLAAMLGLGALALIHAWLATFIYVRHRNALRAARALADSEIERAEAQRSLLAAQLMAANAQVDPAFVLRTLDDVERAYVIDPERGDVLLDEFIAYLRNAIPRMRSGDPAAMEAR
jgi:hypothetical protein